METRSNEACTNDQTSRISLIKDAYVPKSCCQLCKISSKTHKSCWECAKFTLQAI